MSPAPRRGRDATDRTGDRTAPDVRVLVVDDDVAVLDLTARFLELEYPALDVTTETSVDAALTHLESGPPDAVVSDYQMPGTDGLEFLSIVREEYGDVPFVLFTSSAREDLAGEVELASADDYHQKSVGVAQFSVLGERIMRLVGPS